MRDSPNVQIREEEKQEPESSSFDPLQRERERKRIINRIKFAD